MESPSVNITLTAPESDAVKLNVPQQELGKAGDWCEQSNQIQCRSGSRSRSLHATQQLQRSTRRGETIGEIGSAEPQLMIDTITAYDSNF